MLRNLRASLSVMALFAVPLPAGAIDVMQPTDGTVALGDIVTFNNGGTINGLNRNNNGQFNQQPWVLGNPDGVGNNPGNTNYVRLREAMAAQFLKLANGAQNQQQCNALNIDLTCVGGQMAELRRQFTQDQGSTPDVASIRGNGNQQPREIFIAEGKPGGTVGHAVEQLQDFRRLAATGNYALPNNGQLIVTENKIRTTNNSPYAVGPQNLVVGAESACILYNADAVNGNALAAKFFAAEQPNEPDTGPAVSRLADMQNRQPREFAIFFLRPSAAQLNAQTQIVYSNTCKVLTDLGNDRWVIVYKSGNDWFYAQTGDQVQAGGARAKAKHSRKH